MCIHTLFCGRFAYLFFRKKNAATPIKRIKKHAKTIPIINPVFEPLSFPSVGGTLVVGGGSVGVRCNTFLKPLGSGSESENQKEI